MALKGQAARAHWPWCALGRVYKGACLTKFKANKRGQRRLICVQPRGGREIDRDRGGGKRGRGCQLGCRLCCAQARGSCCCRWDMAWCRSFIAVGERGQLSLVLPGAGTETRASRLLQTRALRRAAPPCWAAVVAGGPPPPPLPPHGGGGADGGGASGGGVPEAEGGESGGGVPEVAGVPGGGASGGGVPEVGGALGSGASGGGVPVVAGGGVVGGGVAGGGVAGGGVAGGGVEPAGAGRGGPRRVSRCHQRVRSRRRRRRCARAAAGPHLCRCS
jgi:hypothetical protein